MRVILSSSAAATAIASGSSSLSILPDMIAAGSLQSWQPVLSYTLNPLYSLVLWLAVITMPPSHARSLTANESSGTGEYLSNSRAFIPHAARTPEASSASSLEWCLVSKATATFDPSPSISASPFAAILTIYLLSLFVPRPITPLIPAVPNSSLL